MAKKTQHRPHGALAGRLFGSFSGKTPPGHPVGVLTQPQAHGALTGKRYGSFAGKGAAPEDQPRPFDFGIPLAWYADPGFNATYAWHQFGVVVANRDEVVTHDASGALEAQAATVAGSAVHPHTTTGALTAGSATVEGSADHEVPAGTHATDGALAAQAATVAGTAAHLTLHTTTGALSAQAATLDGTAVHTAPTTHEATGALVAQPASIRGAAEGPPVIDSNDLGGGNGRRARRAASKSDEPIDRRNEEAEVVEFITALVAAGVL